MVVRGVGFPLGSIMVALAVERSAFSTEKLQRSTSIPELVSPTEVNSCLGKNPAEGQLIHSGVGAWGLCMASAGSPGYGSPVRTEMAV